MKDLTMNENLLTVLVDVTSKPKGRIETKVTQFPLNDVIFDGLVNKVLRGEGVSMDVRVGISVKHPDDKYDRSIGKAQAMSKFKKVKLDVLSIRMHKNKACIYFKGFNLVKNIDTGKVYPEKHEEW